MNAKDQMIDDVVQHETYAQAQASNWPRPTCRICFSPTAYDREYRATRCCQTCYREELAPLTVQPKEILPCSQN